MNLAQALHATARRYCDEHHCRWAMLYSKLPNYGRESDDYHYTKEALATFPRYNVLNAIRVELDRIEPATLESFDETRALVLAAGVNAPDMFTRDPSGPIVAEAMADEREKFCAFVRALAEPDLLDTEPLPYNRVLTDSEFKDVWRRLSEKWNITEHRWYPLAESSVTGIEAFQARHFENFCSSFALDKLLASHGVNRVWELREYGPSYEQELSLFDPRYNGAEGYWSSEEIDWILYAPHESSITIGGWLLEEIKKAWPEWSQRVWPSPLL